MQGEEELPSCLSPSLHPTPLPAGSVGSDPQTAGIQWPVPVGGPPRIRPCGARVTVCPQLDCSVFTCVLLGDLPAKGKCSLHVCHTAMYLLPVPIGDGCGFPLCRNWQGAARREGTATGLFCVVRPPWHGYFHPHLHTQTRTLPLPLQLLLAQLRSLMCLSCPDDLPGLVTLKKSMERENFISCL